MMAFTLKYRCVLRYTSRNKELDSKQGGSDVGKLTSISTSGLGWLTANPWAGTLASLGFICPFFSPLPFLLLKALEMSAKRRCTTASCWDGGQMGAPADGKNWKHFFPWSRKATNACPSAPTPKKACNSICVSDKTAGCMVLAVCCTCLSQEEMAITPLKMGVLQKQIY